jgi:hypothetical protein
VPRLLRTMPHVPLMQIAIRPVRGHLTMSAVRRTSVIKNVRMLFDDLRQDTFIDVAPGKIGLPKVGLFVFVVEIQL